MTTTEYMMPTRYSFSPNAKQFPMIDFSDKTHAKIFSGAQADSHCELALSRNNRLFEHDNDLVSIDSNMC